MKYIAYRHFIDVFMTEDEAKAEAAEVRCHRQQIVESSRMHRQIGLNGSVADNGGGRAE